MNKDYFIIQADGLLEAATLRWLRTWLRQYFRKHETATPEEVSNELKDCLKGVYRFYFYRIFHEHEHFKFVKQIDYFEDGPDGFTPIFSLHDDMYSTIIKRNKSIDTYNK